VPTKRSGPRAPRQRVDRPEAPAKTAKEEAAEKGQVGRAAARNPLFPVGVSLYPLGAETETADEWYQADLTGGLDRLSDARFALVRLFVSWRVIEPQVGQYDEDALGRLVELVGAAAKRKMQTIVCFFADDKHSELTDVGWAKKRDPRTDPYLVQREVALLAKVVSLLHGEKGVFAWQLGNEAFLSGFESAEDLVSWTGTMREAIREHDDKRPIGLGADAETLYRSSGVDAREAIGECEFVVSHLTAAYAAYAAQGPLTSGPSTYLESFLLRLAHRGKPVLLDEIGPSTLEYSAGEEAVYLRMALWGGLCNRSAGAMARRYDDMETERREPYFLEPYETLIGIVDSDDETKPAFEEMRKFVRTAARIDFKSHVLLAERTAVMMPAERYEPLPSLAGLFNPRSCLQSFIAAKRAQIPVTIVDEGDALDEFQVVIVPSAFNLSQAAWERLASFVQSGGTLLLSYGGGDAHPAIRDLFGLEFLGDGGPRRQLSCRVAHADILGDLVSFDADFEVPNFALVSAVGATVVATDANGSPLLSVNQVGQGRAVYVSVPLERAIAQGDPWATPEPISRMMREVYGAVARGAGCGAPVACDLPEVEVGLFQGEADDVVVLVNHSAEKVSANLTLERRVASIVDVRGGGAVAVGGSAFGVPIEANGVVALRLTYA
jgi:endo-1,4-beta-mannosidase